MDGKPSKNPRYLQLRGDLEDGFKSHLADIGLRLYRQIPLDKPLCYPVDAILAGRRNNPPEPETGIRSLAVYNPSITRNCRNCSWIIFAASPASRPPPPGLVARAH